MKHKWGVGVGLIVIATVASCYYLGVGAGVIEQVIRARYQLASAGLGIKIPTKAEARWIISADKASDLEPWGLKFAYLDGVYFEGVWRWGVRRQHSWVVMQYLDRGREGWLIVPVRGVVSYRPATGGESETLSPGKLGDRLRVGAPVHLSFLYRFDERGKPAEIRRELAGRRASYRHASLVEAEWEIGGFPKGAAVTDQNIKQLLRSRVVVLDEKETMLTSVMSKEQ